RMLNLVITLLKAL
ncbi:alpha/beta hydrolase fold family protein, partial [Vibrio parahaemolyticus V-223/04]